MNFCIIYCLQGNRPVRTAVSLLADDQAAEEECVKAVGRFVLLDWTHQAASLAGRSFQFQGSN